MTTVTSRLPALLNPYWWFLASGLLLGSSLVPTYIGIRRIRQWVNALESTHCRTPWPHAPDVTDTGWAAVYLVIPAAVCLVVALILFLRARHRIWAKTVVTLAGACVLLVALLVGVNGSNNVSSDVNTSNVSGSDGGPLCHVSG